MTIEDALRLATRDEPLAALDGLRALDDPNARTLEAQLQARVAHLATPDAYAAFYRARATADPAMPGALFNLRFDPRMQEVERLLATHGAQRVLDVGCADGRHLLYLAMRFGLSGTGLDLAPGYVDLVNRYASVLGFPVNAVCGAIEDTDLGGTYDVALAMDVLEHVRDVPAALAGIERQVGHGGHVILTTPLTPPAHRCETDAREHVRLLGHPALLQAVQGKPLVGYAQFPLGGRFGNWGHVVAYQVQH